MSDDERAVFSRAQVRHYDQVAIQHCSVPSLILMENAGRGATDALLPYVRGQDDQVVVACGRGNNGGDGFVVARHLLAQGYANITCWVLAPLEKVSGDARKNLDAWLGLGGRTQFIEKDLTPFRSALAEADVVVDALLGTGLDRPVEGRVRATIEAINDAPADVFSLDIPSGLDADTGQTLGASVTAQATATFARLKAGLLQGDAIAQAGDLRVISLGIPDRQVVEAVGTTAELVALDTVDRALGQRRIDVHKYGAGAVLLAAGRVGSIGAAELTARGAYRAGAGLVTIATWADAAPRLEGCLPEAMVLGLPSTSTRAALTSALERRRAAGVGPGFGVDTKAQSVVEHLALAWDRPVVLDADAITCFAGRSEALVTAPAARILTPHAGELGRLLGISAAEVEAHRFAAVQDAATRTGATVVLKGPRTVIATGRRISVSTAGDPVLATGGSGDVLTGICTVLAAHVDPHTAACAAVELHGRAGERWRARHGGASRGMLAHEIAEELVGVIAEAEASL